jgi:hypothetical protein
MFRKKLLPVAAAVGALAVAPGAAQAQTTDEVAGTTVGSLSLSVTTPATAMLNFTPGQTATASGAVMVTSTGPWYLKVADGGAATAGRMKRQHVAVTCETGTNELASALRVTGTPTLGGTSLGVVNIGATATNIASGTLSDVVTTSYSQPIGATEKLTTGCVYKLTATYTVTATA